MSEPYSCKPILCIGLHTHDPNLDRRTVLLDNKRTKQIDFKEHQYFASPIYGKTIPGSGKMCVTSTAGWICPVSFIIRRLGKVT